MNCRVCGSELPEGALFCGECGSAVAAPTLSKLDVVDERPSDTSIVRAAEKTPGAVAAPAVLVDEDEPETAESSPIDDAVFALRFGTGITAEVHGSGLLGRRPVAQPGEVFDHFLSVDDPERTVSKTHLEFGVEGGEFWVCDRYSANGSGITPADGELRPCEPGMRYRVQRGSRVQIGEQYFELT